MSGGRARDKRVIPKFIKLGQRSYPEQFALGDAEISILQVIPRYFHTKCFECSLFFEYGSMRISVLACCQLLSLAILICMDFKTILVGISFLL